ncbi:MAG: hypothetical protein WDO15_14790 [Bacteroidota bacterium]
MKRYANNLEFFKSQLTPTREDPMSWNNFNLANQEKFNNVIGQSPGIISEGTINDEEEDVIQQLKRDIIDLRQKFSETNQERLDLDLALIFHRNLKRLGWGKFQMDDFSMWRWLSMNYFLKECFWRWGEENFNKRNYYESSRAIFQRLVGERNRRIFPLWYYTIAERLYDPLFGYSLIEKLAEKSRGSKSGGFGNLMNYLTETKLLSPNDHTSKTMSKLLLGGEKLAGDLEVKNSFVRYNAFKRRLLSYASDSIFEKEICIMFDKKTKK